MNEHDATEIAYNNGYAKGYADAMNSKTLNESSENSSDEEVHHYEDENLDHPVRFVLLTIIFTAVAIWAVAGMFAMNGW